ncbi:hypothetical protein RJ492_000527 [Pluralibacter gergoviae]|nr:hypothetical protein [Pluralibacter gergoviae]AVR03745.1 hypothetical protein A8H26_14140 [Pluralibacter gergoviae]EKW7272480.1 hypothetical protein [Pluralibacter gergoviae]ELD4329646.1 hypothetical protein [Pluralibacter gergoviae]PHH47953.1 hypothetical protein CRX51_20255 [Pluralibacter gergoviae]
MKRTWFQHTDLTSEQIDDLERRYRNNNVKTERSLSNDFIHWTLSAYLPESEQAPRPDRRFEQRFWG